MNEVLNFVNEKTKVLLIVRENQLEIEGKKLKVNYRWNIEKFLNETKSSLK